MSKAKTDLWPRIARILPKVERPSRYIGSEWAAGTELDEIVPQAENDESPHISEDQRAISFCMAYPDTYEIGQPNQAVRILTNAVNAQSGMSAERAYLPAADMIAEMRKEGIPAFSLESCRPLSEFDVVGITLPHELCATNVLELLDLSGIPLRSERRPNDDPIVIAGGPCACNPEPFAPFFDVIMIGEGEEALPELLSAIRRLKGSGSDRNQMLRELSKIPGMYIPSLYRASSDGMGVDPIDEEVPSKVEKRVFEGFSETTGWEPIVVPYMEIVHDRLNVEILRGCARGCRFCQGGMMYRPVRERHVDKIVEAVLSGLEATGYEEVSLTSLSSTDHSQIEEILKKLNKELDGTGVRISVPSQRLDSFGVEMASLVAGRKKGGLTFAPEAGTQRLRDVINKNITDDDLIKAVESAVCAGWQRMKLYYMIGLPTETDDDLVGIADMCNRAYESMKAFTEPERRGNLRLGVSVNVFVPKAQTPFQWDAQITSDEARRRVSVIKNALRYKAITLSYHEPKTSRLEALMSRGGREVSEVIELAWKKGAVFDAWTEHFDPEAWDSAADELGIDIDAVASAEYSTSQRMPWSHISFGVDDGFLAKEREYALAGVTTSDCTMDACSKCGVCPSLNVSNRIMDVRS